MTQLKFSNMDDVLNDINARYISFPKEEDLRNNVILHEVLKTIINAMSEKDALFNAIFKKNIFYGGSYYDDLRIGKPNEFDIDLLLIVEELATIKLETCNIPGFIHLKVKELNETTLYESALKKFKTFIDKKNYLMTDEIIKWLHSVVQQAINVFLKTENGLLKIRCNNSESFTYYSISLSVNEPAATLCIFDNTNYEEVMSIDLVPCFLFDTNSWPGDGFIKITVCDKETFFAVPKKPKSSNIQPLERYWRLSFQAQERELIKDKQFLKPTIKLLKLLRDRYNDECIASYYIKTVLLHKADEKSSTFWSSSLSNVFMTILNEYKDCIQKKNIQYYWNKKYNLIDTTNPITLENISNRLIKIIKEIENNSDRPEIVAKHLLDDKKFKEFIEVSRIKESGDNKLIPGRRVITNEEIINIIPERTVVTSKEKINVTLQQTFLTSEEIRNFIPDRRVVTSEDTRCIVL